MKNSCPIIVLLSLSVLWGCATARMYPVKGPLAAQTPPPVYSAKLSAVFDSGTFSAQLANGERFKGTVSPVLGTARKSHSLAAEWDSVYGVGYFANKVLDAQYYLRGTVTGSNGTVLQVEMYKNDSRPALAAPHDQSVIIDMNGVAKDSNGNVYKLVF